MYQVLKKRRPDLRAATSDITIPAPMARRANAATISNKRSITHPAAIANSYALERTLISPINVVPKPIIKPIPIATAIYGATAALTEGRPVLGLQHQSTAPAPDKTKIPTINCVILSPRQLRANGSNVEAITQVTRNPISTRGGFRCFRRQA